MPGAWRRIIMIYLFRTPPPDVMARWGLSSRIINRAPSIAHIAHHHYTSYKTQTAQWILCRFSGIREVHQQSRCGSHDSQNSSLTLLAFGARKPYLCSRGKGCPARMAFYCALRRPILPPYGKNGAIFSGNFPRARKNLLRANSDLL